MTTIFPPRSRPQPRCRTWRSVVLRVATATAVTATCLGASALDADASRRPRTRSASVPPAKVWVVGDSLAWESIPAINQVVGTQSGIQLTPVVWGGTAPCDLLPEVIRLAGERPLAVAISFSGNALHPCMFRDGQPPSPAQLVETYRADIAAMRAALPASRFIIVGQPAMPGTTSVDALNVAYRELADSMNNTEFIDAGAFVEAPDGSWTDRLACLPFETAEQGCTDGTIEVRAPDRGHLCSGGGPAVVGVTTVCEHYSSGTVRFGGAIATALLAPSPPPPSEVMIFGDTTVAGASASFRNVFGSVDRTRLRARNLVTMTDWRATITGELIDPETTVVVALGTDDALWTDLRHVRSDTGAIAARLGAQSCVVWVGVNEHAAGLSSAVRTRLRSVNRTAQRAVSRHRTITWLDWSGHSARHPEWFVNNTTVLTEVGQLAYADAIADAIPPGCPGRVSPTE
jgi:hypothetical protein